MRYVKQQTERSENIFSTEVQFSITVYDGGNVKFRIKQTTDETGETHQTTRCEN
jgi:hypothetical protein